MTNPIPMITVSGTAAERGESYGRQAAPLIERAVLLYRAELERKGIPWDEAMRVARGFLPAIEVYDASQAIEIEAIAKGAGQEHAAVLVLNARTELLFWKDGQAHGGGSRGMVEADECTSVLALPEATLDGRLLHAQNWDWQPSCVHHLAVLRIKNADIPDSLNFVEAGQLARHGFNSEGVAITAMGLHSNADYGRMGIPNPLIRRKMIASGSLAGAIGELYRSQRAFSHALILSHPAGEGFCFETTPDEVFWQEADRGILTHSNHFKIPAALARAGDINIARCPETLYRDSRVRKTLLREHGRISAETVKQALSDSFGRPDSVLRFPAARPGGMVSATVYTLIMDTTDHVAWLCPLPASNAEYTAYSLA